MANILLGDWRLRIADENHMLFDSQVRIHFFDANTTDDEKEVFADINSDVSLGSIVELDSQGYVPVSGIWLAEGAYSAKVEKYVGEDIFGNEDWFPLFTIPYIAGAVASQSSGKITTFKSVSEMRAFTPDGSNGLCLGYYNQNDGGGDHMFWDKDSLLNDDGGSVFKPTSYATNQKGRWIRIFEELPSIQDFGAIEGQQNVKINIINAQNYSIANGVNLIYPNGLYSLSGENLRVKENSIIKDKCYFDTTGSVEILCENIESISKISDNLIIRYVDKILPEWFGALGNGFSDDSEFIAKAYLNTINYGGVVYFTKSYSLAGDSFNVGVDTSCIIGANAEIGISNLQGFFSLGKIEVEGNNKEFLFGELSTLIVLDGYKSSYFFDLDVTKLASFLSSTIFIWDSDFVFDEDYSNIFASHKFINNSKWTINQNVSVNVGTQTFDKNNFDSIESMTRLGGKSFINASDRLAISLNDAYTFLGDIYFIGLSFALTADVGIRSDKLVSFDLCDFTSTTIRNLNSFAEGLTFTRCTYDDVTTNLVTGNTGHIVNYRFQNNTCLGDSKVSVVSDKVDAFVKGLFITQNIFDAQTPITSFVVGTGTFNNDVSDGSTFFAWRNHKLTIKDNKRSSEDVNVCASTEGRDVFAKTTTDPTEMDQIIGDMDDVKSLTSFTYNMIGSIPLFVLFGHSNAVIDITYDKAIVKANTSSTTSVLGFTQISTGDFTGGATQNERFANNVTYGKLTTMRFLRMPLNVNVQGGSEISAELTFSYSLKIYQQ